ncbi:MAG: amino acid permease [Erysipelotrichaceae bacterium]
MKRYGYPLIVIVLASLLLYLFRTYVSVSDQYTIYIILESLALFIFGVYLNGYKSRKSNGWVKKFIVFFAFMLLVFMQLGIFELKIISVVLSFIRANSIIYFMLYVYLGYIFF